MTRPYDSAAGDAEMGQLDSAAWEPEEEGVVVGDPWPGQDHDPSPDIAPMDPDEQFSYQDGPGADGLTDDEAHADPSDRWAETDAGVIDHEEKPLERPQRSKKKSNLTFYAVAGGGSLIAATAIYFFVLGPPAPSSNAPMLGMAGTAQMQPALESPVRPQMMEQPQAAALPPAQPPLGAAGTAPALQPGAPVTPGREQVPMVGAPAEQATAATQVPMVATPPGAGAIPAWVTEGRVNSGAEPATERHPTSAVASSPLPAGRPGQAFELADGTVNRIGNAAADQVMARLAPELQSLRVGIVTDVSKSLQALDGRVAQLTKSVERLETRSTMGRQAASTSERRSVAAPKRAAPAAPAPQAAILDDWALKGVSGDRAWIAGGRSGVIAVKVGDTIAGAGRVTEIARRGGGWAVVTTHGLIVSEQAPAAGSNGFGAGTHVVQKGETWSGLLTRSNRPASAWYAANPGLEEQIQRKGWLYEGQRLTVPQA